MDQLNGWGHQHASEQTRFRIAEQIVDDAFASIRPELVNAIESFLASPLSPTTFHYFECALLIAIRELGRIILQAVVQSLEPQQSQLFPKQLYYQSGGYRRRSDWTRNANVATRLGNIVLWRTGYRSWQRGEETVFPLELMLGLTGNVSPALLDLMGKTLAAAGNSQQGTIAIIKEQCGVSIGVKRLRSCLESLADGIEPLREACQVEQLLEMLQQANDSSGSRKPVLSVGRDGITLRQYQHSFFEVTDSGGNEVNYFRRVLQKMKHPVSGQRLEWVRVADFYHTSERVWAMADALFPKNQQQQAYAWARRMLKKLKRPSGASRVLHSAASLYHRRKLGKKRKENFWKAYRYLQSRTQYMKYSDYKQNHLPIGSGVTEAACKTIYTQRLKLSGMRWSHEGARRILTLRTILLSGTWKSTYGEYLSKHLAAEIRP